MSSFLTIVPTPVRRGIVALTMVLGLVFVALMGPLAGASSASGTAEDPALEQTVTDDEEIVTDEPVVLDVGHVDLGPRLIDGEWIYAARDDSQTPPVWRHIEDVVLHVHDEGVQALPETGDYDFTGAGAGEDVWVVPQVEIPGVVWLGWNTQDPAVVTNAPDGVTLRIHDVQGPGQLTMFLQPGNFEPPQVLVDPTVETAQDIFIETNTHTHVNWVFTQPGIYLVDTEFLTTTTDGEELSTSGTLRFSVGDETDPEDARAASWQNGAGPATRNASDDTSTQGNESEDAADETDSVDPDTSRQTEEDVATSAALPWILGGAIVVIIAAVAIVIALRSRKARQQQEQAFQQREERGGSNS